MFVYKYRAIFFKMPQDKLEEDSTLPKATVDRLIQDLTPKPYIVVKEVRNVLREIAHQFLSLIALEANTQCELEKKKTITNPHIYFSLKKYGFESFIASCELVAKDYDDYSKHKPSKQNKFKDSGKSMEELEEIQKNLFKEAAKQQEINYEVKSDTDDNNDEME